MRHGCLSANLSSWQCRVLSTLRSLRRHGRWPLISEMHCSESSESQELKALQLRTRFRGAALFVAGERWERWERWDRWERWERCDEHTELSGPSFGVENSFVRSRGRDGSEV
mmetsp:Transcript_40869/g.89436  ORF Transcript_40869/g.89436 Transcript_40869/m.89436 type:complete len:112 (-) Transcript_40869:450-785(-)